MNPDWQTIFYVVASLTLTVLLGLLLAVFILIRRVTRSAKRGIATAVSVNTILKVGLLKTLLKLVK